MNWLKEQFSLLKDFMSGDFRRTLGLCALGMLLAAALGVGIGLLFPQQAYDALNAFMEQIADSGVIDEAGEMSVFALLLNNWRAMVVSAAYGFIPFIFLPLLSLVTNGALMGLLASLMVSDGTSLLVFLAGIVPHGIFEIPALLLSVACGMCLCRNMCRVVVSSPERTPLTEQLEDQLRVLVLVIAPLTAAAAFIECYVTPFIMSLFV